MALQQPKNDFKSIEKSDGAVALLYIFPSGPQLSHPIHVFVCESECTRGGVGGGAHSCMLLCCQLAECRPWSHRCSMTCTYMGMTSRYNNTLYAHLLTSIVNTFSSFHTSHLFHYSHSADLCPVITLSYSIALLFGTLIPSPICMLRL